MPTTNIDANRQVLSEAVAVTQPATTTTQDESVLMTICDYYNDGYLPPRPDVKDFDNK